MIRYHCLFDPVELICMRLCSLFDCMCLYADVMFVLICLYAQSYYSYYFALSVFFSQIRLIFD
ncbi:hypothetical protein Hanom_Chr03g00208621 [Helianthus anomalus]